MKKLLLGIVLLIGLGIVLVGFYEVNDCDENQINLDYEVLLFGFGVNATRDGEVMCTRDRTRLFIIENAIEYARWSFRIFSAPEEFFVDNVLLYIAWHPGLDFIDVSIEIDCQNNATVIFDGYSTVVTSPTNHGAWVRLARESFTEMENVVLVTRGQMVVPEPRPFFPGQLQLWWPPTNPRLLNEID